MEEYQQPKFEDKVTITLSRDTALVLSDMLWKWEESNITTEIRIADDAEWHALSRIAAAIDAQLPEIIMRDYLVRVQQARNRLVAKFGKILDEGDESAGS